MAQRPPAEQGWIPLEERLPDIPGQAFFVPVEVFLPESESPISQARYMSLGFFRDAHRLPNVSHWRPAPVLHTEKTSATLAA